MRKVMLAEVSGVDLERKEVIADGSRVPYDTWCSRPVRGTPISGTTTGRPLRRA